VKVAFPAGLLFTSDVRNCNDHQVDSVLFSFRAQDVHSTAVVRLIGATYGGGDFDFGTEAACGELLVR
jgi:hypothetical protein